MATLYSNSTGNFTAASTWSVVEPTTFVSAVATQETGTTNSTTAFVSSTTFTGVSSTLDGLALKISSRSGAPTGTFSTQLAVAGVAVPNTTVTVNVADIPNGISWIFFKFPANVTLVGATTYTVQLKTTTNAQATVFRKSATAADWTFALRTTTTQAPAAGDNTITGGEWDSAGVNSSWTITMNNTAATQFGSAVTGEAGLSVNANSTFAWGTAAATAYVFNLAGALYVNNAGTYTQGTLAVPIPSGSSGKLNIVQASNVQFGIEIRAGGIFKTGGNPIVNTSFLAADASAGATSLTTSTSTAWKNGDVIAISSTTRTRTEAEAKALTADAVTTTLTITALTNAHSGTAPTAGELINLTRNVSIFGTSTSLQSYININATATVDIESTEIYFMGSATASKRGIDVGTTTGSFLINGSSIHDFLVTGSIGINVSGGTSNNYQVQHTNFYNIAAEAIVTAVTTGSNYTLNAIKVIAAAQNAALQGISIGDLTGTITSLTVTSTQGVGIQLADLTGTTTEIFGTLGPFTAHSNSTIGVSLVNILGVTNNPMALFSNITSYRNGTVGLNISNTFTIMVDTVIAFGNTTNNVQFGTTDCINVYLKNMTIDAGTTLTSPIGLEFNGDAYGVFIDSSTFGATTTHSTGDVTVNAVAEMPQAIFRNCTFGSTTLIATPGNMTEGGFVSFARFQQTSGSHKTIKKYGIISSDSTIFNSGPRSARLTPNNADSRLKLQGGIKKIAVPSGQIANIKVFLRKSVVGDGTAYNGNQPRLMLRIDPATGTTGDVDTVLATTDNTYNGVFKALTATTPVITDDAVFQVYIDCDGTQGWVNEDDWSIS